jgi:hypothetical protein
MSKSTFIMKALKLLKKNSPEILTALGVAGVVTTSYLASKASFKASEMIADDILKNEEENPDEHQFRTRKDDFKLVWKKYIPPAIAGAATIGCIIGASKASNHRTAAAVAAWSISEKAFTDYKEKVVEQLGKGKDRKVRDELAQDHVLNNPVGSREVLITGRGDNLCCELLTRRYFKSDIEELRKSQNIINADINNNLYVTLDDFYDLIGLSHTSVSDKLGWDSGKLMELVFTTTLSEDGVPCLAFEYNYTKPLR